jgi:hypothetical protein
MNFFIVPLMLFMLHDRSFSVGDEKEIFNFSNLYLFYLGSAFLFLAHFVIVVIIVNKD